ncbi:ATP-binding protein [Citrobacter sp. JGM124]|uniref:ATP-binding protein n=1 Tax=Citrobacter sp. JGM124 TaxID=2799789 RepID=UPI001BAA6590|nr:ATP-binding protein [Citrobacter sp. JGM124]MBS0849788.1 response regulator [Citrobacter sp. JGM124]
MSKTKNIPLQGSSYQAPQLSNTLLLLFAISLSCIIIATSFFYIYYYVNNTISDYRRQMNAAAYNAQDFFDDREAGLKALTDAIISLPMNVDIFTPLIPDVAPDVSVYPLGEDKYEPKYGIIMTQKDRAEITRNKLQLVYTSSETGKTTILTPDPEKASQLSAESENQIATFLSNQKWPEKEEGSLFISWFNTIEDKEKRLYLYTPVDINNPASGWLGIKINNVALNIALSTLNMGNYDLVDPQGRSVLHSDISASHDYWVGRFITDTFGLTGDTFLPEYLVLRKSVGRGDWSLVYSLPVPQLIKKHLLFFLVVTVITVTLIIFVVLSILYLSRRVLKPAIIQYSALTDSEALNRKLVETVSVGLVLVRIKDAKLLFCNELAQSWVQSDTEWYSRISVVNYPPVSHELTLHDGRTIQLSYTATSWGGDIAILCVLNDISRLKDIEHSLVEAKSMAESANQAKTLFLTTMSHEIRTPLYGILGTLELFALSQLSRQQKEYLKTLLQSSSSLLRIVDDSLDLSSIEAGQLRLTIAPFSPMELAELVVSTYAAKAENKGLQLYAISDVNLPHLLLGDTMRIRQILDNLVNNAIKFTHYGHVVLRLSVEQQDDDTVRLIIKIVDTGMGINSEHLLHLFEPYFRSTNNLTESIPGSGLGLSICSRLTQAMGGALHVVSQQGLGSQFTFEANLPIARDAHATPQPYLLPEPIYVDGAIPEIVNNTCEWLRHWGAQAFPLRHKAQGDKTRGIMIQTWPPSQNTINWPGRLIIALPPSLCHEQNSQHNAVITGAYSIVEIGHSVQAMQQQRASVPSETSAFTVITERFDLCVLIIDDSPVSRTILCEQLELFGCNVVQATNGLEAMKIFSLYAFDAVMTDLYMPDMNGLEVTTALREQGYKGRIIGLTGNAYQKERNLGLKAGMDSMLHKPLSLIQLRSVLRKILKSKS